MKHRGSVNVKGKKVAWEHNISFGPTDYSGFGFHGKAKRVKNRADRRQRKLEEKRARMNRDW